MAYEDSYPAIRPIAPVTPRTARLLERLSRFPWWVIAVVLIALITARTIYLSETYLEAFRFIVAGLSVTMMTTLTAFLIALVIGLVTGMGRISQNILGRNIATLYVELIRGIPMLVLIFFIALVGVPTVVQLLNSFGHWLNALGFYSIAQPLVLLENKGVPMNVRAIIALAVTYGAFLAEVFRAGIQSIDRGQMEAARSQGMTYWQAMRYIILPQAIRNVLPALGNDFVSMLKDSSLVSVLAVRDITQVARLYAGQTFRYPEAYATLSVIYLSMTMLLSMLVKVLERRYHSHER
ncbi:MAG: amino acid ABC transporter permease [Anaerolineales bacterium]